MGEFKLIAIFRVSSPLTGEPVFVAFADAGHVAGHFHFSAKPSPIRSSTSTDNTQYPFSGL